MPLKKAGHRILELARSIVHQDYLFSILSKFTGVFIALLYSVVYNRYLGAALKGEAAIIANYSSLMSSIVCFGMYQAYPLYRRQNKDEFYPFLNNMTSLYLLIFAASVLFSVFTPGLDVNFRAAVIFMPVLSYIRHINYIVTIENPRLRNISSVLINLTDLLVVAVMWCFTQATYPYLVLILSLQTLINLALSYANLKAEPKYFRFTLSRVWLYAKFGFLPMITLLLMTVNYRIDVIMLERASLVTKAQIGIYSLGVSIAEKVWLVPDAIKDILLSKLCKGNTSGEVEVSKVIRLNTAVSIGMILVISFLSVPMVHYVYGAEYYGAEMITTIILLGTVGMIFYKMIYSYNISRGKRLVSLIFLAISAALNVIGNYFLIPLMGIYGAALTSVISYSICGLCFLIYFHHASQIPYHKILFIQKEDIQMVKQFFHKAE